MCLDAGCVLSRACWHQLCPGGDQWQRQVHCAAPSVQVSSTLPTHESQHMAYLHLPLWIVPLQFMVTHAQKQSLGRVCNGCTLRQPLCGVLYILPKSVGLKRWQHAAYTCTLLLQNVAYFHVGVCSTDCHLQGLCHRCSLRRARLSLTIQQHSSQSGLR